MLGESISSIGWPDCGEIDIMEHVGYDNGNVHGSIHTKDFNHMMNTQKSGSTSLPTVTQSFHTYSLEWSPNYLRFLIDDSPFSLFIMITTGIKQNGLSTLRII